MNVFLGTKLSPELTRGSYTGISFRSTSNLMMHHTKPPQELETGSQATNAFDWRRVGIMVYYDWFSPLNRAEIVGNAAAVDTFDDWARQWRYANNAKTEDDFLSRLPERCCAFIRGPPGVGKRTTVNILLRKHGYTDIVHVDAGAMHTKQLVDDRLLPLLLNANPKRAIVIEELDGLRYTGGNSANASDALLRFLSNDAHKVRWGEAQKLRSMARGGLARFATFYDEVAEARLKQNKSGCVTSCPVILVASDHQYQFIFKTLERACGMHANCANSGFFLFRPVRTEDIEHRYAQLASRYNFYTRAKNVKEGKADWVLLHDLATVAGGDMRKAITMLVATIRHAYIDKQMRQSSGKEDDCVEKRLILRRRHCEALLRCQLTVQTSPFQACSFLLHDCPSVSVALNHIARFRMNNVPDVLFGGFHKIAPVGKTMSDAEARKLTRAKQDSSELEGRHNLAGLVRLADTADAFSRADIYRQRFDYVRNESTHQIYHDSVTMWSLLLLNLDQGGVGYVFSDEGIGYLRARTFCRNFANCRKKDCNCRWMQKSSLEAQRGQRAQWQRMGIEERNQYDQQTGQTMQTTADRFLYYRNYVNSVQQVRKKSDHLANNPDLTDKQQSELAKTPVKKRLKKSEIAEMEEELVTSAAKRKKIGVAAAANAAANAANTSKKRARKVIESDDDENEEESVESEESEESAEESEERKEHKEGEESLKEPVKEESLKESVREEPLNTVKRSSGKQTQITDFLSARSSK